MSPPPPPPPKHWLVATSLRCLCHHRSESGNSVPLNVEWNDRSSGATCCRGAGDPAGSQHMPSQCQETFCMGDSSVNRRGGTMPMGESPKPHLLSPSPRSTSTSQIPSPPWQIFPFPWAATIPVSYPMSFLLNGPTPQIHPPDIHPFS